MKHCVLLTFLFFFGLINKGFSQEEVNLYSGEIPNSVKAENKEYVENSAIFEVSQPELSIYLPKGNNTGKTAVIICPGGGYIGLCITYEGIEIAQKLNKLGVAAFVLKYRLPNKRTCIDPSIAPLHDAQRAIQLIRENAVIWGIDPYKIGIMGFSAGGHVASTAGTHFNKVLIPNPKLTSVRPDFMVQVYPVISMESGLTHAGSRENLLGDTPSKDQLELFSNEKQVTVQTPPTFLIHAGDDDMVPVENSFRFYDALKAQGVSADMHIFSVGKHGFPLEPAKSAWFDYWINWMHEQKLISDKLK